MLIPAGTLFEVVGSVDLGGGLFMIQLKEIYEEIAVDSNDADIKFVQNWKAMNAVPPG